MQFLNPPNWETPRGYSNGICAEGRMIFVAGQIGWNAKNQFESGRFTDQARQALKNTLAVLAEAGGRPEHIVRMTWYIVDKKEYLAANKELGAIYRELIGSHYPAMSLVQVAALLEDQARVEIETTAILPTTVLSTD